MNKELEETEEMTMQRVKNKVSELFDYVVNIRVLIDLIESKNKEIDKLKHSNRSIMLDLLETRTKLEEVELENERLKKKILGEENE